MFSLDVYATIPRSILFLCATCILAPLATATSNHEYGPDEYVTIAKGISPNGEYAITAHGTGDLGYDNFHLYLTDALTGKTIGPLEEIVETLDTGADAFSAKWAKDSQQVIIIYRVDRHAPLKAVCYRITNGRAHRINGPFNVTTDELIAYWQNQSSQSKPSQKIFGLPVSH